MPNILKEEDLDLLFVEIVTDKDFEEQKTEGETFESKDGLKHPQEKESYQPIVVISVGLNQKKINDSLVQALFKRSRHISI